MSLWAIVPVKPFAQSKSRLAPVLSPSERLDLSRHLLEHTLTVLGQVRQVDAILVISRDPAVHDVAIQHGAMVLEEQADGLNQALAQATTWAARQGATAVLVVPADLPLLTPSIMEAMIRRAQHPHPSPLPEGEGETSQGEATIRLVEPGPAVVIAPDRHGHGTNLLLIRPPGLINYAFGPDSFAAHRQQAIASGAGLHVFHSRKTELDLDTPDDLILSTLLK